MEKQPTLRITIENKEDIELFEFTNSMQALSNQYYSFLNAKSDNTIKENYKLYVKKLTNGSIIIDLCEKAPEILPIVTPVIVEFSHYIVSILDFLCGETKEKIYKFAKNDLLNFKKILEPIANVSGNKIGFLGINFGTINISKTYNNIQASAGQNKCEKEIKLLENGSNNIIKETSELILYQARNSKISSSLKGNLGIIKDISDKPKPLSFVNDRLKYDITNAEDNPFNFVYIVDLEVKLKDTRYGYENHSNIKGYEILKLHSLVNKEDTDLFSDEKED